LLFKSYSPAPAVPRRVLPGARFSACVSPSIPTAVSAAEGSSIVVRGTVTDISDISVVLGTEINLALVIDSTLVAVDLAKGNACFCPAEDAIFKQDRIYEIIW
jgi:hypothetical protein